MADIVAICGGYIVNDQIAYFEYEKTKDPDKTHFDKVEKGYATFIKWGVDYEELEHGVGSYSTAIIRLDDGTIKNVHVDMIRFLKPLAKGVGE